MLRLDVQENANLSPFSLFIPLISLSLFLSSCSSRTIRSFVRHLLGFSLILCFVFVFVLVLACHPSLSLCQPASYRSNSEQQKNSQRHTDSQRPKMAEPYLLLDRRVSHTDEQMCPMLPFRSVFDDNAAAV